MTGNVGDLLNEREKVLATKNQISSALGTCLWLGLAAFVIGIFVIIFVGMTGHDESIPHVLYSCGFLTLLPLVLWCIRAPFTIPKKKKLAAQIRDRVKRELPVGTEVSIGLSQDKKELRPTGTKTVYYHGLMKVGEYDNYDKVTKTTYRSASGVISEIKQNSFAITMSGWTWGYTDCPKQYLIKGGGETEIKFLELGEDSVGAVGFFDNELYYINYINAVT